MPLFLGKKAFKNLMSICGNFMSICGVATAKPHVAPVPFAGVDDSREWKQRTPEEVKARKKAYKRRKAAKAARRRNRK